MFEKNNPQERGQVGIGTLIVFIALVLVAAIAAGVLINTAGFLQSQAQATGEESTSQVSNAVTIESAVAPDSSTVNLTVKQGAGSEPVDLDDAEIQLVGSDTATLGSSGDLSADGDINNVVAVDAEDTSNNVLEAQGDTYVIEINIGNALSTTLSGGDEVDLTLTTGDGAQSFKELRVGDPADFPEAL